MIDELCRRALGVSESSYEPDHYEVAMTCANLAVLRFDQGDFGAAEAFGRRALGILQIMLGPEDADVGLTMLNLSAAIAAQDRLREAAAFADCARAILIDQLPADHPHVVVAHEAVSRFLQTVPI